MATIKAPCKGCPDRWVNEKATCHSECEKYKQWSKQQKSEKIKDSLQKKLDKDSYSTLDAMSMRKGVKSMRNY